MSDAVGPGDLVLCVNAAPNHVTGEAVPLVAGETYRVWGVMEFACPCRRSDALLDIGVDFAWCQSRFRLLPKPKFEAKPRKAAAPKEKETVR
ncbi:MAG: hypothetical protein Q8L66_13745 [Caulobacter sp.]|nr:hypothetical protein [Caulobacter sp.]